MKESKENQGKGAGQDTWEMGENEKVKNKIGKPKQNWELEDNSW